jgi:hypothetical protein
MLLYKGRQSINRGGVLLLLGLFGLLIAYAAGYIMRVPIAWQSDYTMVVGVFAMLLIETAVRSGMIPVNSQFKKLFAHSTLNMRIIDDAKRPQTALNSANAVWYVYDTFIGAIASYPEPAKYNDDTLLFAAPIIGGYALWQEDISDLNKLHRDTEASIRSLQTANAVLAEEGKIKQAAQEETEKTRLMTSLGEEISGFTIKLSAMIEQLENTVDKKKATARIILLLCYIKRRCNLFFRQKEADAMQGSELSMYLNELAEMAGYAGIKIVVSGGLHHTIFVRHATIFYDFYYSVLYWATWVKDIIIIAHLGVDSGNVTFVMLPSDDAESFRLGHDVMEAVKAENGIYAVKDIDGDFGLSLSFPTDNGGGVGNG